MKIIPVVAILLGAGITAQKAAGEPPEPGNVGGMKDLDLYALESVRNLCEDLAARKCYTVLVLPVILGGADDPMSDGERQFAGNRMARVVEQDVPSFYEVLQKAPKHMVDVKPGEQYELVFLMKDHPTSDDYRIRMRICDGKFVLRIRSKGGNGLFVEAGPAFSKWMDSQLVNFPAGIAGHPVK